MDIFGAFPTQTLLGQDTVTSVPTGLVALLCLVFTNEL